MSIHPARLSDAAIAAIVLAMGAWELVQRTDDWAGGMSSSELASLLMIVGFFAVAAGLHRLAPGFALTLVWLGCSVQVLGYHDILYVELAGVVVSFGCARWGRAAVVWLSALSIPAGTLIAVAWVMNSGTSLDAVTIGGLGLAVLAVPWLAGLVLRVRTDARHAREHEVEAIASKQEAEQLAALREQQARLAHDVHDVVGHSLAVILAQAESAQYLPEDDPVRMRQTMANIATSARQSLRDVRQVLSSDETPPQQDGGLDRLIEGVREAGNDVQSTVVGTPRPLPPEIDTVAYRTLQEMLTNAVKHGVRGQQVTVLRHWADELTIAVQNKATPNDAGEEGLGLSGMRRRLASVGGRLDLRHEGDTFTATAWLPLRHGMLAP